MISNVYELYQGLTPIKRVYLNDGVVWRAPTFLHPYLVQLDSYPDGAQILNKLKVESGNMIAYSEDACPIELIGNFGPSDTFLVNRIVDEIYAGITTEGSFDTISTELLNAISTDRSIIYSDSNVLPLIAELLKCDRDEVLGFLSDLHAFDAYAELIRHEANYNVSVDQLIRALDAPGKIGKGRYAHDVTVTALNKALAASARIGAHRLDNIVEIIKLHKALTAKSEIANYYGDNLVDLNASHIGLAAIAETWKHSRDLQLDNTIYGGALSAIAKLGACDNFFRLYQEEVAGAAVDLLAKPISIDDVDSVDCTADNILSRFAVESISLTDNGSIYAEEVSAAAGSAEFIASNTSEYVTSDDNTSLSIMFWMLPQQTDSNLYIPQIYDDGVTVGAVQNSSELILL